MLETHFQRKLIQLIEDVGAVVLNVHGHSYQKSGWPDLYVAHWAWSGWMELKVGRNRPSPLQREMMISLARRRVNVVWVRLKDDVVTVHAPDGIVLKSLMWERLDVSDLFISPGV